MFYKKSGIPEEGELVICTVKKILPHSVFVSIDEYTDKEGMIHISEVSPGRIRNIRDFVREGKIIVCKVLRLHRDKGHIDLSLRRVALSQRKKKEEEYKQEQKAEKLIENIIKELKITMADFYNKFGDQIFEKYSGLNELFQTVLVEGENAFSEIKIDKKLKDVLVEKIKEKIKLPEVIVEANLKLSTKESDGIDRIKKSFEKTVLYAKRKNYKIKFTYLGSPKYRVVVTSSDYKTAEKTLNDVMENLVKLAETEDIEIGWQKKS